MIPRPDNIFTVRWQIPFELTNDNQTVLTIITRIENKEERYDNPPSLAMMVMAEQINVRNV